MCALSATLAGCAGERLGGLRLPLSDGGAAPQAQPAPQYGVQSSAPDLVPNAAATPAAPMAPPVAHATDAPVGAGVNVRPGDNEDFIVNVGRRVFFTEGSSVLTPIARETLDNQAQWLQRYPHWRAKIQGFADDPGSDDANLALGKQRADAVLNYLTARGVAPGRLRAKTYGRSTDRLVRACTDSACKAQNRRVITNLEAAR